RRRHTRWPRDWSSDVCSSDLASDDNDLLADGELVTEVYVKQEIDAFVHSIEINTRNAEITATMGTHRDQNGIESLLAQIRDHEEIGRASCREREEVCVVCGRQ